MLVDRGEDKVTSFKLAKYGSAAACIPGHLGIVVFIDGDANMKKSRERKRIYASTSLTATCISWTQKAMILKPTTGCGRIPPYGQTSCKGARISLCSRVECTVYNDAGS